MKKNVDAFNNIRKNMNISINQKLHYFLFGPLEQDLNIFLDEDLIEKIKVID